MKNIIKLLVLGLIFIGPAFAGDKDMTCAEIAAELEELASIETAAGNANTNKALIGAGASAAGHAAVMSGAGKSIPFIGGLVNVANSVADQNAANAEANAKKAADRTIKLETIADMKGC